MNDRNLSRARSIAFNRAKKEIRKRIAHNPDKSMCYQWSHIKQLVNTAKPLAEKLKTSGEKINVRDMMLAAFCLGITQSYDSGNRAENIKNVESILEKHFPKKKAMRVIQIICDYSSENTDEAGAIEAKVLLLANKHI